MNKSILSLITLFFCISLHAQQFAGEQVFLYTDKDNYVAGEEVLVKMLAKEDGFHPTRSKVGYVELCDTERPYFQLKLALDNGKGNASFKIPDHIPSGIYQLVGYTRYMRNQNESTFFTTHIAVMNMDRSTVEDVVIISEIPENNLANEPAPNVRLRTDKTQYTNRNQVHLYLENLPDNVADLVVAVYRNDSLVSLPSREAMKWSENLPVKTPLQWLPELEGHIMTAKNMYPDQKLPDSYVSFVGDDIVLAKGQPSPDNSTISFLTMGVYGTKDIVLTAHDPRTKNFVIEIESPFQTVLPATLPPLKTYINKEALTERYISTQLSELALPEGVEPQFGPESYFWFSEPTVYNLDEYVRFKTLPETFTEYLRKVRIRRMDDKRVIWTFLEERQIFSSGPALVLMDGALVTDHEKIIDHDPQYIQFIKIYDGRYVFGGEVFDGIVSFQTYNRDLPFFQLPDGSQLFSYDCPVAPEKFHMPNYADSLQKASRKPDFRHTLYWNPDVPVSTGTKNANLSFFTSDFDGEFQVVVKGFTTAGEPVYGTTNFIVAD